MTSTQLYEHIVIDVSWRRRRGRMRGVLKDAG
jgi:hypothetical protein